MKCRSLPERALGSACSKRGIQQLVEIRAERGGIDQREPTPTFEQCVSRGGWPHRLELGNWSAIARDRYPLSPRGSIDDLTAVVAKLPNRDVSHR